MRAPQLSVFLVFVVVSCGGGGGGALSSPCELTDATTVQASFGGTVSDGVEGQASNCEFGVDGGVTDVVHVYYYGTDEGWDGTRQGFEDNRGGVTDISGIGDEAFHPNDTGPGALIVRAGGHIFSVGVISLFEEPGAEVVDAVGNLAAAIAADLG